MVLDSSTTEHLAGPAHKVERSNTAAIIAGDTAGMNPAVVEALRHVIVLHRCEEDPSLRRSIHRAVARGDLVRLVRGSFIARSVLKDMRPWEVELLRVVTAAQHGRVRQPICGLSAARVWGVPILEDDHSPLVHALGWHQHAARRTSDVQYWATTDTRALVVVRNGVLVTDLARTIAEMGARAPFARAVAAIDWAVRVRCRPGEPVTSIDEIRNAADALGLVRGRARLERALSFADGRAESPGESWARVLFHELGFEAPELQHEYQMPDGRRFRTDFRWGSVRVAGEFDGEIKYRAGEARGGRSVEQVVIDEKAREDAVRSTGDGMLRCVWADLRDSRRLRQRAETAGVPRRAQNGRTPPKWTLNTA